MAKNVRMLRVADRIRDEVSLIISTQIKDPRMGFITITRVEMSRDLRHAKIRYSTIGSQEDRQKTDEALKSAQRFIRRQIGHRLSLRFCPEIEFIFDQSVEDRIKIDRIFKEIEESEN